MSLINVSFIKSENDYIASVSMSEFLSSSVDLEPALKHASEVYKSSIEQMDSLIDDIQANRRKKVLLPARKIWKLGDSIFNLVNNLEVLGFQLDNLYEHLERDLNVKRKWLEKVIILRRYLPDIEIIPSSLNWGKCEKGTRRVAEILLAEYRSYKRDGDRTKS